MMDYSNIRDSFRIFPSVLLWFCIISFIEAASFFVVFHPLANTAIALSIGLVVFLVSLRRPMQTLPLLAIEFVIGSKGALFKAFGDANNDGGIAIRIILFSTFFLGWFIWAMVHRRWTEWNDLLKGRQRYLVLVLILVYAFVLGLLRGNRAFLFADANAWGVWLLLLPVLDLARTEKEEMTRRIKPALLAAFFWLPVKTLFLFYFFTHGFPPAWTEALYLWVRRTGVGEITRAGAGAYRVFFQSHVYALFVVFWLLIKRISSLNLRKWEWILLVFSLAQTIISLSRSFGLGLVVGGVVLLVWTIWRSRSRVWTLVSRGIVTLACSMLVVVALFFFPFPLRSPSSLAHLFQSRMDVSDDAASSRWKLLPVLWSGIIEHPIIGSGFGATVTYQSKDPRIVQKTGGTFTTYAFEWGWLEHWLKFGLVGIPLMVWLLVSIGKRGWKAMPGTPEAQFIILSLVILASIHAFTPYLNHPLGFAWLIGLEGYLMTKKINAIERS